MKQHSIINVFETLDEYNLRHTAKEMEQIPAISPEIPRVLESNHQIFFPHPCLDTLVPKTVSLRIHNGPVVNHGLDLDQVLVLVFLVKVGSNLQHVHR